jgi:hypothetical protein
MGRTVRRQNFESTGLRAEATPTSWPARSALKVFSSAQASQAIEKVDSARENPRKSKQNEPSSKAHCATRPRLADDIQMSRMFPEGATSPSSPFGRPDRNLPGIGAGANFSRPTPCKLLKTNDRRRFAAENGGKRGRPNARIRATSVRLDARPPADRFRGASRRLFNGTRLGSTAEACRFWRQRERDMVPETGTGRGY